MPSRQPPGIGHAWDVGHPRMRVDLHRDDQAISGLIFGLKPARDAVMANLSKFAPELKPGPAMNLL
jgi:hypothetical protein